MKTQLDVIKIGGNIIDDNTALISLLKKITMNKNLKIIVHGGGKIATQLSKRLGIKTQMVDGRRITSAQDLEIVTMVYAGLINKTIVAKLQNLKCNAIGLSGCDMGSILSEKRQHQQIDFGFVGDVKKVNTENIGFLLSNGFCPVFSPVTHDGNGQLLNTNADTIAAELAIAFAQIYEVRLLYCFEKNGVLSDAENDLSLITDLNNSFYELLKKNRMVNGGMIPKLDNCFRAMQLGVSEIVIGRPEIIDNTTSLFTKLSFEI